MGELIVTLVLAVVWFAAGFANGRLSERKRRARDLAELEVLANLAASASAAGALIAAGGRVSNSSMWSLTRSGSVTG